VVGVAAAEGARAGLTNHGACSGNDGGASGAVVVAAVVVVSLPAKTLKQGRLADHLRLKAQT